jgi:aldehyde:ferredoxin oxidoreductase
LRTIKWKYPRIKITEGTMEQKYNGFWGRILKVDLSSATWHVEEPEEKLYRTYMGGGNFAMHYLIKEIPKGIDAFDPENRLVFMTSPLTGTPISGQGRHTCAALSPLTGGLADSQSGGWWGAELKFAGYDGIVISGKSDKLVTIRIEDEIVEILETENLRGKKTGEAQEYFNAKYPQG